MSKITVTRPFTFSHPGGKNADGTADPNNPASSHDFTPGEYEVHDSVANHPWIKAGADGAISKPVTKPDARAQRTDQPVLAKRVDEQTSATNPGGIDDEGNIANRTTPDPQGRQPANRDGSVSPSGVVKDVKGAGGAQAKP